MSVRRVVMFSDFDGTMSLQDVGYHLFHHFSAGKNAALIPAWQSGEMSSREILRAEAALCQFTDTAFRDYVMTHVLDPSLGLFSRQIAASGGEFIVLSDGLRPYIDLLLAKHDLSFEVIANDAAIVDGALRINFPYENHRCGFCGSCKRERIAERLPAILARDPETVILFAGDGMSDRCIVEPAWPHLPKEEKNAKGLPRKTKNEDIGTMGSDDSSRSEGSMTIIPPVIVYAKKELARFCSDRQIPFRPFLTFQDIADDLTQQGVW